MNKYLLQKQQYLQNQNSSKSKISDIIKIYTKGYNLKIAFWDNCLCERGTTVALYDYAYCNKHLLNNQSIILYNNTRPDNNQNIINRFKKEFDVFSVNDFNEVDNLLKEQKCDIFYIIKDGKYDTKISNIIKTVVHCVFNCDDPHGNVYAAISPYLKNYNNNCPVVPHMINLPDTDQNMRSELNIPNNAIVYGRYGGKETFDIEYVHEIVYRVAKNNNNIYFLFANTNKFCDSLPNIIHIGAIIDPINKVKFINTCNAKIWGRKDGETFGLSIGEFSTKNKPVIATKENINDIAHIELLKDMAIWYNKTNLESILTNFNVGENSKKDWNAYRNYTPQKVIQKFKKVFINNISNDYSEDYLEIFTPLKKMYIYFNAFWPDCKTDISYYNVFIRLFSNVYNCDIQIGNIDNSDILIESIWGSSCLDYKKWKYSYFYSGEPELNEPVDIYTKKYTALLKNSRSEKNIIHFPFFVYYKTYASIDFKQLNISKENVIPKKFCCTFITNPNSSVRNKFIEKLEKYKQIDHFGKYKNNQTQVNGNWHSKELIDKMKEYKFVIAFENSENYNSDSYITEKIINPLLANVIPIYWGNKRINEYFNIDRILHLYNNNESDMDTLIKKIIDIDNSDVKYMNILKHEFIHELNINIDIDTITNDIRRLLFNDYREIYKVVCIVDEKKEPERYTSISSQLLDNNFQQFLIKYSLPTYYDTIESTLLYKKINVNHSKYLISNKKELSLREISLFLNFYIIFKQILGYYKEGIFMILESDVIFKANFNLFNLLLSKIDSNTHDCISFGSGCNMEILHETIAENNIELYKNKTTRCTDSFLFSYKGIEKFVKYIESKIYTTGLDNPIDFFMNECIENNYFDIFWTLPSLTFQGSQHGVFQSNIQY